MKPQTKKLILAREKKERDRITRLEYVGRLISKDMTYREIGIEMGITHQRVAQLYDKYKKYVKEQTKSS